jgi:hypothetical protein
MLLLCCASVLNMQLYRLGVILPCLYVCKSQQVYVNFLETWRGLKPQSRLQMSGFEILISLLTRFIN